MTTRKDLKAAGLAMRDATEMDSGTRCPATHDIGREKDPVLVLANSEGDRSALNDLVSEWLVPLLIRDFFVEQDALAKAHSQNTTAGLLGKEGAAKGRIR